MKILFVCSANICRSPVAEHYFRHLSRVLSLPAIDVSSAGILGIEGAQADPVARKIAAGRQLDLAEHRSRGVTREDLYQSDKVIVMERRHRAWIRERYPDTIDRVSMLLDGPTGEFDLLDPTGGTVQEYTSTFETLFEAVEAIALAYKYPR